MPPILFKSCPRCGGDFHQEQDIYGKYLTCLQCGYSFDYSDGSELWERMIGPQKRTPDAHQAQTHSGHDDAIIDTSGI